MESKVPYGTQWIRDLVPDVSWDQTNQNIVMPDGDAMASYQAYGLCKRKLTDLPIP